MEMDNNRNRCNSNYIVVNSIVALRANWDDVNCVDCCLLTMLLVFIRKGLF
jgi:hypothetical protein